MPDAQGIDYDAIVIGGGPSGSSYAITLARSGRSVLVLERETFPRFHIGESMLPYTTEVLDQFGLLDRVLAADFPVKTGLEICGSGDFTKRVALTEAGDGFRKATSSLERAHFDKILLDAMSEESGTTVLEDAKVTGLIFSGERVAGVHYTRQGKPESATARFVIDASGRAGVVARALNLRTNDATLKMAAVFKHFGGVDEQFNPGVEGDTQIGVHDDAWLWAIPVRKDAISIGVMTSADRLRTARPDELFESYVDRTPRIRDRLRGTEVTRGLGGEQNFEYHADTLAGPGYFLIGDAGCFTDPVFSAGVFLALTTGRRAAEESIRCLEGEATEADVALAYQNFFKTGYESYYRLIRCHYDSRGKVFGQYMAQVFHDLGADPKYRVLALGGDLFTDTNPFINRLRAEPGWDLFSPFERVYGCPVYGNDHATAGMQAAGRQR